MKKIKIICVVGATASGKTALGVELAKALGGEVISADSMQVYKDMPIATAAATEEEKQGVPHHLLEFLDTNEEFSVARFVELAKEKISEITARGAVPIIVGGTGLFIDSLVKNITFAEIETDKKLRESLSRLPADELYERLKALDAEAAENIHKNNKKRVIRALELCYAGTSKTRQNEQSMLEESPYDALYIGINYADRQKLYDRINLRVDKMLEAGLEEEAKRMVSAASSTSRQALGHKELKPYFDGELTLDEAADNLKRETRRYAKRQLTWFRKNESINWLYADEMSKEELIKKAASLSEEFLKQEV